MHLAAMVDLGVPVEWVVSELNKLKLSGEFEIVTESRTKMGISGTYVRVDAKDQSDHRHYDTIVNIIGDAKFDPGVEQRALDMFARIARAEAKIHDIPLEKVHFHEVGAIDSIVDIAAAALCIEYINPAHILCNAVEVGSGYVDCAHGRFPVPAPATQEILAGVPLSYGNADGESTTPTGAAILASNVTQFAPEATFSPQQFGYGIGHKDFNIPNVLRVARGDYASAGDQAQPNHVQIEANIDDMSAEAFDPLAAALFRAGAVDVFITPIVMKKGRPAHTITALASSADQDNVADTLLNQSSTIGLRIFPFSKRVLERQNIRIETPLGPVDVKQVEQPDGRLRWKTEHEDILAICTRLERAYLDVKREVDLAVARHFDSN